MEIKSLKDAFDKSPVETEESADSIELAVPIKLLGTSTDKRRLAEIINRASKSELGKKTLENAVKAGYSLEFSNIPNFVGVTYPEQKTFSIGKEFSDERLVSTLVHEAAHVRQHDNGASYDLENGTMKTQIMLIRAMEADANSVACAVGFELKQNGDEDVYEEYKKEYPFIANPFEKTLDETGDVDKASTAAFKGWYDSDWLKETYEDILIVQRFDHFVMFGQDKDMKFDNAYTGKEIVDKACLTENGKNYFTDDPKILEQGKFIDIKQNTMDCIKSLMESRKESYGLESDKSVNEIPVYNKEKDEYVYEKPFSDNDIIENKQELAVPVNILGTNEEKHRLEKIINRTAKSEFGKKTLEEIAKAGYTLDTIEMAGTAGLHKGKFKTITLNPTLSDDNMVGVLAHEARHACQYLNNVEWDIHHDTIKTKIMLDRAMEADAERAACVTCWQLKQNGDEPAYAAFEKDSILVAKGFEYSLNETGSFYKASTEAFKSWYQNPSRKNAYDKAYIVKTLERAKSIDAGNLLKFDKDSTCKEIINKVCFDENGKNYFIDNPEILEKGRNIGVYPETMDCIKDFMKYRQEEHGLEPDKSINEIPVYDSEKFSYVYEKPKNIAVIMATARKGR